MAALALIAIVIGATAAAGETPDWKTYRNDSYGYELKYAAGWQLVEAKPRVNNLATWAGNILLEGELQKVTLVELGSRMWLGEFQVRVLSNPNRWSLEEWAKHYDVTDVGGDSSIEEVKDTNLGGKPAKEFAIFMFDHQGIEVAALHRGLVYHLSFAGDNPNDPGGGPPQKDLPTDVIELSIHPLRACGGQEIASAFMKRDGRRSHLALMRAEAAGLIVHGQHIGDRHIVHQRMGRAQDIAPTLS